MIFTCTSFDGHWPVGTSAVVNAESHDDAAKILEQELAKHGLPQKISAMQMVQFTEQVKILQDGDY
jgi:hypothetical protein